MHDDIEEAAMLSGIVLGQVGEQGGPVPLIVSGGPAAAAVAAAIEEAAIAVAAEEVAAAIQEAADIVDAGQGVTPGPVPVRPASWDLSAEPYATYTVASGDTFTGLAATYLLDGARWLEIWNVQPQAFRWGRSPDELWPGDVLAMPEEAKQNFLKLKKGDPHPGGDIPVLPGDEKGSKSKAPWIIAGMAALAGGAYYLSR